MKAEDLMIGDLVLYNETHQQILEISGIDDEVYLETDELVHQSEIQPIPLTPEVLEKNGFLANKHVYPYPYYKYEVKEIKVKVGFAFPQGNRTSYKEPWVCVDTECVYIEHLPCMFVHQLQHVLRLCGIEKEIEL
jgi:hypothetical protein